MNLNVCKTAMSVSKRNYIRWSISLIPNSHTGFLHIPHRILRTKIHWKIRSTLKINLIDNAEFSSSLLPQTWNLRDKLLASRSSVLLAEITECLGINLYVNPIWHGGTPPKMFLTTVLKRLGGVSWNLVTFNINLRSIKKKLFLVT